MSENPQNAEPGKVFETERQLRSLRRMLDLYERERKLTAYEIHDGPVQHMAACLMHLESLERLYGNENEPAAKLLHMAIRSVKTVQDFRKALETKPLEKGVLLLVRSTEGSRFVVIQME